MLEEHSARVGLVKRHTLSLNFRRKWYLFFINRKIKIRDKETD